MIVRVSTQSRTGSEIPVDCPRAQGVSRVLCVPAESYLASLDPDSATLARAYGLATERVAMTADFAPTLDRALAAPGSRLIELVTGPETISVRSAPSELRRAAPAREQGSPA